MPESYLILRPLRESTLFAEMAKRTNSWVGESPQIGASATLNKRLNVLAVLSMGNPDHPRPQLVVPIVLEASLTRPIRLAVLDAPEGLLQFSRANEIETQYGELFTGYWAAQMASAENEQAASEVREAAQTAKQKFNLRRVRQMLGAHPDLRDAFLSRQFSGRRLRIGDVLGLSYFCRAPGSA